ncbi:MAG: UbiA family prenyltransferase [Ignavibacteria bacterium]|nr:UbiA family prenyltransferase [Ignavibacteria bacterium]
MNSTLNKFTGLFKIIRPLNCTIVFLVIVAAAYFYSNSRVQFHIIFFAALSGFFVSAAGNIINDYFDLDIDRINRPERVLPSEILVPMEAVSYYFFISVLALLSASFVNIYCLAVVIYTTAGLYLYSARIKKIPLLGNIIIAHYAGLAFIFGGLAAGNWVVCIIPAVFAFLINLIREIVKDIEDIEGDKANGIITFPQKFGIKNARNLIFILTVILIYLTYLPYKYSIYKIEYFLVIMCVVNVMLVFSLKLLYNFNSKNDLSKISGLLKIIMLAGLFAIFTGK